MQRDGHLLLLMQKAAGSLESCLVSEVLLGSSWSMQQQILCVKQDACALSKMAAHLTF